MANTTYTDIDTIDARINELSDTRRARLDALSDRNWIGTGNDRQLADIENELENLWRQKRAAIAALHYRRDVQDIPTVQVCAYQGCTSYAHYAGYCGTHRRVVQRWQAIEDPCPYTKGEMEQINELHRAGYGYSYIAWKLGRTSADVNRKHRDMNSYRHRFGQGVA